MPDVLVKLLQKHLSLNAGETVSLPEATAAKWCGELDPRFRVAARVPQEQYTEQQRRAVGVPPVAKMADAPPMNKMEEGPAVHKAVDIEEAGDGKDTGPGSRGARR